MGERRVLWIRYRTEFRNKVDLTERMSKTSFLPLSIDHLLPDVELQDREGIDGLDPSHRNTDGGWDTIGD